MPATTGPSVCETRAGHARSGAHVRIRALAVCLPGRDPADTRCYGYAFCAGHPRQPCPFSAGSRPRQDRGRCRPRPPPCRPMPHNDSR
eukprot:6991529-Pyramimonas_sp.AAC.1